jgi:hypothetical protein
MNTEFQYEEARAFSTLEQSPLASASARNTVSTPWGRIGLFLAALGAAAAVACGGTPGVESDPAKPAETSAELATSGFGPWTIVSNGSVFSQKPALRTSYSAANNRSWTIIGTSGNTLQQAVRNVTPSGDSGWHWSTISPPPGQTLSPTGPAFTTWTDNSQNDWAGIAARVSTSSCFNCIYLQVSQHAGASNWYLIPNSGLSSNGFAGSFNLIYSGGYLYIVATGSGGPFKAYITSNNVASTFDNSKWSAWTEIPGGGLFSKPVSAWPIIFGGILVAGSAPPNGAVFYQKYNGGGWAGSWTNVGGFLTQGVSVTNFSSFGDDMEFFGTTGGKVMYEGDLNATHTVLDGWYSISGAAFIYPPAAYAASTKHIDLAAIDSNGQINIKSFDKP